MLNHKTQFLPKELETNRRLQYGLLALLIVGAAILRLYKLGEWSFWIDELYTINRAEEIFTRWQWPSLIELLMGTMFRFTDVTEWSSRLIPALIGILSIPILYFFIRRTFGTFVALLAGAIIAFSPWHLFWSQNARFYTILLLLYTIGLLLYVEGLEKDRGAYLVAASLLLTLAVRERLTAFFYLPIILGYGAILFLLPWRKPPGLKIKNFLPLLLPLLFYGAYDLLRPKPAQAVTQSQIFGGSSGSAVRVFFDSFVGNPGPSPLFLTTSLLHDIGMPLIILGSLGGVLLLMARDRRGLFLLIGTWAPFAALVFLSLFTYTLSRYGFVTFSFWAIAGAVGVKEILSRVQEKRVMVGAGIILLALANLWQGDLLYFKYQQGNRPDWKGAAAVIADRAAPEDAVYASQPEIVAYYLGRDVGRTDELSVEALDAHEGTVWFIENGWIRPELNAWLQEHGRLLGANVVSTALEDFTVRVHRYRPSP